MQTFELIVHILTLISAVLLIVIVLLQDSKNSGLGSAFGNDTTALGASRNAKAGREAKLQKITIILAIMVGVFALLMLVLPGIEKLMSDSDSKSSMLANLFNLV